MCSKKNTAFFLVSVSTLIVASLLSSSFAFSKAKKDSSDLYISGWVTYWDLDKGAASVQKNSSAIDEINLFYYVFDETGSIKENKPSFSDNTLLSRMVSSKNFVVIPTIVNDLIGKDGKISILKDPEIVHRIVADPSLKKNHIRQLLALIDTHGFDGIDIDYENVYFADKDAFSEFIKELSEALHVKHKLLTVTVQPKKEEKKTDGAGASDWKKIGAYADTIKIMCYNYSSTLTAPGPLSPPAWIEEIIRFAQKQIPPEKLLLVFPLHGYEWCNGKAKSVHFLQVMEEKKQHHAKIRWSKNYETPYFTYLDKECFHEVWFENQDSIAAKLRLLKKYGIRNIGLWRFGQEDQRIYQLFNNQPLRKRISTLPE